MRIVQERTPAGCMFALAAGFLALSFIPPQKHPLLDYTFVGILIAGGIFQMIYRKIYPDSVLVTDALPQPGEEFRGTIETPLKSEPGECKVKLELTRRRSRTSRAIFESEQVVHPMRGERGILFPVQFSIPAGVRKEIDQYCNWRLSARAKTMPVPYRASFKVEDSSRNPKASV
jgi:hypothetical protein